MSTTYTPTTFTTNVTLDNSATVWYGDCSSNHIQVTLPSLSGNLGKLYTIKRIDNNYYNILRVFTSSPSDSIEGSGYIDLYPLDIYTLHAADSNTWRVLNYTRY